MVARQRLRRAGTVQFSMTGSLTRANSAVLFVTNVRPNAPARAAMDRSLTPIIVINAGVGLASSLRVYGMGTLGINAPSIPPSLFE